MKKKKRKTNLNFEKEVLDTIRQYDMISRGDKVLVATSGGADSVSLLKTLLNLKKKLGIEVVAANIDHSLRGEESAADSKFVKSLAKEMGIDIAYKKIDVKKSGTKKSSIEEKARKKRYEFLSKAAKSRKCNVIATGHTMDDQAETVLMRVIHGSSTEGISGIPPVRKQGKIRIVRPLIRTERKDIIAFLQQNNIKYVEDSSNENMRMRRNKIRKLLLPHLEEYNPRVKRALVNLADNIREDTSLATKETIARKGRVSGTSARIKISELLLQPKAIRKRVFKELFTSSGGSVKKLTYRHWISVDEFLKRAQNGKSLDLPGEIRVTKKKDELIYKKRSG